MDTMSNRLHRPLVLVSALAAAASLTLAACSPSEREAARQTGEAMGETAKDVASGTGEAAMDAATATGQAALTKAVNPVLDLLKKAKTQVKEGDMAEASTTMNGFSTLWVTAGPVIQPLAGDKWPMIDAAAQKVLTTFDNGTPPDRETAVASISGLMTPLSSLLKN
jgi:hypothetical protein